VETTEQVAMSVLQHSDKFQVQILRKEKSCHFSTKKMTKYLQNTLKLKYGAKTKIDYNILYFEKMHFINKNVFPPKQ